jgi:hypothetical protein
LSVSESEEEINIEATFEEDKPIEEVPLSIDESDVGEISELDTDDVREIQIELHEDDKSIDIQELTDEVHVLVSQDETNVLSKPVETVDSFVTLDETVQVDDLVHAEENQVVNEIETIEELKAESDDKPVVETMAGNSTAAESTVNVSQVDTTEDNAAVLEIIDEQLGPLEVDLVKVHDVLDDKITADLDRAEQKVKKHLRSNTCRSVSQKKKSTLKQLLKKISPLKKSLLALMSQMWAKYQNWIQTT